MDTAELIYEWVKDNYGEAEADEPSWDYESLAGYLDEKKQ